MRIGQCSVVVEVRIQIIGASLGRIVGKIEDRQRGRGSIVIALVAVGIKLAHIDLADIVVGKLFKIAADMSRSQRTALTGEERVNVIP